MMVILFIPATPEQVSNLVDLFLGCLNLLRAKEMTDGS